MNEPSKVTITDFVTENDKVLAAIGIFVALAAFSLTLPLRSLSVSIAFASLVATFPLIFELTTKFLNRKWAISLLVFTNICAILWFRLLLYVLVAFRDEWYIEMPKIIFWMIMLPPYGLYRRGLKGLVDPPINWILARFERFVINALITFIGDFFGMALLQFRLWRLRSKMSSFSRRRTILRSKRFSQNFNKGWLEQSELDWKEKPNEFPRWLFRGLILLLPIYVMASVLQAPIARVINIAIDIEAESYQITKSSPEGLNIIVPPVQDPEAVSTPIPIIP